MGVKHPRWGGEKDRGEQARERTNVMGSAYRRAEFTTEYYCARATYLHVK